MRSYSRDATEILLHSLVETPSTKRRFLHNGVWLGGVMLDVEDNDDNCKFCKRCEVNKRKKEQNFKHKGGITDPSPYRQMMWILPQPPPSPES